jgi:hypothetical protein
VPTNGIANLVLDFPKAAPLPEVRSKLAVVEKGVLRNDETRKTE